RARLPSAPGSEEGDGGPAPLFHLLCRVPRRRRTRLLARDTLSSAPRQPCPAGSARRAFQRVPSESREARRRADRQARHAGVRLPPVRRADPHGSGVRANVAEDEGGGARGTGWVKSDTAPSPFQGEGWV